MRGPSSLQPAASRTIKTFPSSRLPVISSRFCLGVMCALALSGCSLGQLGAMPAVPVAPNAYAEQMVARAHALQLASKRQWQTLLHYRLGVLGEGFLGGGYVSDADGPGFFLSERGKVDPQAE